MPMYDFRCPDCGHEFEELVFGGRLPDTCPSCGGQKIERKVSTIATRIGGGGGGVAPVSSSSCGGGSPFS